MSVAISWANKMQLAKCDIMAGFLISSHIYTFHRKQTAMFDKYVQVTQLLAKCQQRNYNDKQSHYYSSIITTVHQNEICTVRKPFKTALAHFKAASFSEGTKKL